MIIRDAEVVRVAEVLVSIGKGFKPRVVLYTDSCLRLTEGVKLNGISKSKVERAKILIFCLLIVTGWGLYARANQTTEIYFANSDNSTSEWTVSVKQGEIAFTMFDTKTEFSFSVGEHKGGSESGESGESGKMKASKTNGSNATVASSKKRDTVGKIVKNASQPAQQQNPTDAAKNTIMTRLQASKAAASSKVNEADKNNTSPKGRRKSERIAQMRTSSK